MCVYIYIQYIYIKLLFPANYEFIRQNISCDYGDSSYKENNFLD